MLSSGMIVRCFNQTRCLALCVAILAGCGGERESTLAEAAKHGDAIRFPVEAPDPASARRACARGYCLPFDALAVVFDRSGRWMAEFQGELRFDAAIGLSQARRIVDSSDLRRAFEQARAVADGDDDHPHRRFWVADLPAEQTAAWAVPTAGEPRANTNRVISEALHCRENGWRAATTAYVCGPMRDSGGYQTVHGLWALQIASDNGCIEAAGACRTELQAELAGAQPATLEPRTTLDVDLYAERLLLLLLSGYDKPSLHTWAKALIAAQQADGSWGVPAEENPYFRYHATNAATWALAQWYRHLLMHPHETAPLGTIKLQAPGVIRGRFWGCALPPAAGAD